MIDSHMRFIKDWDTALIAEIARCNDPKAFLSSYPPGYKPPDKLDPDPRPAVLRAKDFNEHGDIRFDGESLPKTPEQPLRGAFLAGGFVFTPGAFIKEIPYDPHLYFDQEEITLSTRAFTHGWNVYHPTKIFLYHYYNTLSKEEKRATHWNDNHDWTKLQQTSRSRYNFLLTGIKPENQPESLTDIDKYGLGKTRSLQAFENFTGIDFKKKTVSEKGLKGQFIEGLEKYRAAAPQKTVDTIPPFQMYDDTGHMQGMILFAGRPGILCILPSAFDVYVKEFMALYRAELKKFQALNMRVIFVAPIPAKSAAEFRARNNIPQSVMADESLGLCQTLGISQRTHDTPHSYVFDAGQKITGTFSNRNALNHINDLLRAAESLSH
jgi:peroxiredoxin